MSHREVLRKNLNARIRGQEEAVDLCLAGFLAGGHILLEGAPGTGKTSLANALANSFHGEFRRVQMTSDLLPSDILGIVRVKAGGGELDFRKGPIFANVVLADELNRTNPKTQAALLEAMAEQKVTVDGVSHPLPSPFFVVATQNPFDSEGVYPVTESQLDRFMLQIVLGVPSAEAELDILRDHAKSHTANPGEKLDPAQVLQLREQVKKVYLEESVLNYAHAVVLAARKVRGVKYGIAVRGELQFLSAARAFAFMQGRDFVTPADIAAIAPAALAHRLSFTDVERTTAERQSLVQEVLRNVPPPK